MRVVFRCDASMQIGTGHVMRCLTLAQALRAGGHNSHFICRDLPGHLAARIADQGFAVSRLPAPSPDHGYAAAKGDTPHAAWAGVDWARDAAETRAAVPQGTDWLIVDHYAFDARWEAAALPEGARLMVIDDLFDRPHIADVLLDQNLGRLPADYDGLIPEGCLRLIGAHFALLRPEFALWRARRPTIAEADHGARHLLITMGGMDTQNCTPAVLRALNRLPQNPLRQVTVVMGASAPGLDAARAELARLPMPARLLVDAANMAKLMCTADLAIGGAGGTALERCCLGLPTLTVVMAENQRRAAKVMQDHGTAITLADVTGQSTVMDSAFDLGKAFAQLTPDRLRQMTQACLAVTDGQGTNRVTSALLTAPQGQDR
jgi:UDP-2,4-diacetamido-2,4,6-trideoxy-beta-L-altropyranose hydrolase